VRNVNNYLQNTKKQITIAPFLKRNGVFLCVLEINGGYSMIWVNTRTKRYFCPGSAYYGKTKQGQYLNEAEAIGKGFKGARGKKCGGV
jgi:hypothetical protein